MLRYTLTVTVPDIRTFEAYAYGYGNVVKVDENGNGIIVTLDYGEDKFHADYQADRFWSGLYPARVEEKVV